MRLSITKHFSSPRRRWQILLICLILIVLNLTSSMVYQNNSKKSTAKNQYKNDHQIWIPKFLKSLHWLQFIWMVCEMLQLQFQHLRHRWQNEKVTETMTRRSLYLWHDLFFFQAMEIWEIKKNLHKLVWGLWWWRTLFEIQPKKIITSIFFTKKIQIELENWRCSLRSHSCENETFHINFQTLWLS